MHEEYFYVCDGNVPHCHKTFCKWEGKGECAHTSDVFHARYAEPRVFTKRTYGDAVVYCERIREEDE